MMNKIAVVILAATLFCACEAKKEPETKQTEEFVANDNVKKESADDQVAQGDALVKASDCKTCHHPTNKIIGPSHTEVAKKYEFTAANVKILAEKIMKGGQGVWGQIPMIPHPDITSSDAEKMARYVLSLDGEKEH